MVHLHMLSFIYMYMALSYTELLIFQVWIKGSGSRRWRYSRGFVSEASSKRMFSILKWKCSWSLIATIASIVGLVSIALASIVHLFFFPLVPSFDYFSLAQNSCVPINGSSETTTDHVRGNLEPPIDLDNQFPADLHKAVVFRGAPWKAEIGRWLAGCGSISNEVNIVEVIRTIF